ncbi:7894_t:CDS:2 [Racocetra fulgida]|uniref:7894_t:CDS:1 n=1 Tax=Racocetra fulgida TaxID=60492 RepID=A0A9N8YPZ1_9GLOM|nr:7894_t:CDS:2 [Racocetra fulgida]
MYLTFGPLELNIGSAEIETKKGKKAVEKIIFAVPPSERGGLKNILESKKSDGTENKEFELAYDDEDLEIEDVGPNLMMSSSASESSDEPAQEINLITLTVKGEQENDNQNNIGKDQKQSGDQNNKKSGDTDKQALIDKYIKEIKAKLQAAGISDEQAIKIEGLGNSQDNQQNQTPKGPTKEQIDEAAEKLKNAKSEEELEEALKKTRDTANNSSDEELKKQKEEKERELGEKNKQKAREIIRDEVNGVLEENGIKPEDLSTEIFNAMGEKALEKLIVALEQAIKNKNKNEVESQSKKLQEFVNSQVDYKKLAYEKKRDEVQRLLDQAKNYSTQNSQNNEGFFRPNNPLMWVSGVAVVGIVAGAILIIRSRKRKAKQALVQDIKNNFQQARAVIFYNFHHTENRELFKLKKELKKVGVEKALSDYSLDLKQANAFIFCQEDEYKPLNILNQFAKKHSSIKRFQGGIYEQKLVAHTLIEK